jgi:hypothetical protein
LRSANVGWAAIMRGEVRLLADPRLAGSIRSRALGLGVHATIERWYGFASDDPCAEGAATAEGEPNWTWYPGQVARAGLVLLPHPAECLRVTVESDCRVVVDGVTLGGRRDLVVLPGAGESKRLGVAPGLLLVDHKSTSSPARYALSSASLKTNAQACVYALATMLDPPWGEPLDVCAARWVYYDTTPAVGTRERPEVARGRALPVDAMITREGARAALVEPAALARKLDRYTRVEDAPCNTDACYDYGGCQYHQTAGGPCTARRSLAARLDTRSTTRGSIMAMSKEELEAKFAAAKKTAPAAEATPAARATTRVRRAAAPAAEAAPATPTPTRAVDVESIVAASVELADAEEAVVGASEASKEAEAAAMKAAEILAAALAARDALVARIREACG